MLKHDLLEHYFNGDIPTEIDEAFYENDDKDYVFEFLKTQNIKFVLKELNDKYSDKIIGYFYENENEKDTPVFCVVVSNDNKNIYKEQ